MPEDCIDYVELVGKGGDTIRKDMFDMYAKTSNLKDLGFREVDGKLEVAEDSIDLGGFDFGLFG